MTELNVLYFAPCVPNEGIKGSARLNNMLDILQQLGAKTQLISYVPKDRLRVVRELVDSHLSITSIQIPSVLPKFLKAFAILLIFGYGLRHARRSDIILALTPGMVTGFPALVLARLFRKPLIVDIMDARRPEMPKFIYNSVLRNSNAVLAISRYLEREVEEMGSKNIAYIPAFIDSDVFQQDYSAGRKIRSELNINDNDIIIGYAGSFWKVEGVALLLKSFKNLSMKHNNIKLVLIGGKAGGNFDDVPQLITEMNLKGRAISLPLQPYEKVPKFLSAFDIVCSPKIDCIENRAANPIKVSEYMSMGLPVVASAVGEVSNIIENGKDGFLVKPGDVNDLEKTLEYVIQNLDFAREVGARAREKVINNCSQKAMLNKIGGILKQVLPEKEPNN